MKAESPLGCEFEGCPAEATIYVDRVYGVDQFESEADALFTCVPHALALRVELERCHELKRVAEGDEPPDGCSVHSFGSAEDDAPIGACPQCPELAGLALQTCGACSERAWGISKAAGRPS